MPDKRWGSSWNQEVTPVADFETAEERFERDWERMDEARTNDPLRDDTDYDRKERGFDRRSTERKAREYATVENDGLGDTVTGASGDTYDRDRSDNNHGNGPINS